MPSLSEDREWELEDDKGLVRGLGLEGAETTDFKKRSNGANGGNGSIFDRSEFDAAPAGTAGWRAAQERIRFLR